MSLAMGLAVLGLFIGPQAQAVGFKVVDGKPDAALAGTTEIDWSGAKGVLLRVPKVVAAPQSAFHLYVSGGTYAFVRFMSATSCRHPDLVRCDWHALTRDVTNSAALRAAGAPPGEDFTYVAGDPAEIEPGLNEFYLFTDGRAKLVFRTSSLPAHVRLNARRAIRGEVKSLNRSCGPQSMCSGSTPVGELTSGGAVHDFGNSLGASEYVTASGERGGSTASDAVSNRDSSNTPTGCIYPSYVDPAASAEPSRHPFGCDISPVNPDPTNPGDVDPNGPSAWAGENQNYGVCAGTDACFAMEVAFDRTGKSYVGFRAARVSPDAGSSTGWAIWYSYGIR